MENTDFTVKSKNNKINKNIEIILNFNEGDNEINKPHFYYLSSNKESIDEKGGINYILENLIDFAPERLFEFYPMKINTIELLLQEICNKKIPVNSLRIWYNICRYQKLNRNFIRKYCNYINWKALLLWQDLDEFTEEFLNEFKNIHKISNYSDFLREFVIK